VFSTISFQFLANKQYPNKALVEYIFGFKIMEQITLICCYSFICCWLLI